MDIRSTLLVRINNDLVDQLDQLVVCRRADVIGDGTLLVFLGQTRKQVADRAHVQTGFEELIDGFLEVLSGRDLKAQTAVRKHILRDPRGADMLRINRQDHHPFGGFLQWQPQALLDKLALQVLQQIGLLDPVCAKRLIGHAEESCCGFTQF